MINQVASLIAEIDPAAANVFRNNPFQRATILKAFVCGCNGTKYEDLSFRIFAAGMKAIELERGQ